jgi:hypothetical protein
LPIWLLALLLLSSTRQLSNHFRFPPRASCLNSHVEDVRLKHFGLLAMDTYFRRFRCLRQSEGMLVSVDTLRKLSILVIFVFLILVSRTTDAFAQNEAGETVNSVEVQLNISGNIYQGLQERIEYSVNRVGEKMLISQPVSLLENNKQSVKQTIFNVFSKVLTGFKTDSVELLLGEHTKILLHLTPLPPFIAKIDLNLKSIAPEWDYITKDATGRVTEELNQIFTGLPVKATAWADNILKMVVNYLVEREFPGFTPVFTIATGEITHINMRLIPLKPVISELEIHYSSASLPIWLVRAKVKKQQQQFNLLKGLPVEFLILYKPQIEQYYTDYLNGFSQINQAGLVTKIAIASGAKTEVDIAIGSLYYQTKLEARGFTGENNSFGNLQAYCGYKINDCEIYARLYSGENPGGLYQIGFSVPISTNFYGGLEYEMQKYYKTLCLNYQFERGDYLELNLGLEGDIDKALIGFLINSNLNLEFVNYDDRFGVQLMFHLW